MLNPDFKSRWLEALRSGNYQQGSAYLVYQGRYCCLGVAYEACGIKRQDICDAELLDYAAAGSVGLTEDQQSFLAQMNDAGKSFAEIAEYIRENL